MWGCLSNKGGVSVNGGGGGGVALTTPYYFNTLSDIKSIASPQKLHQSGPR